MDIPEVETGRGAGGSVWIRQARGHTTRVRAVDPGFYPADWAMLSGPGSIRAQIGAIRNLRWLARV
jgi:hypothetical protein